MNTAKKVVTHLPKANSPQAVKLSQSGQSVHLPKPNRNQTIKKGL